MRNNWVYFLRPVGKLGPIKIGYSEVPKSRLDTIGVWCPFDVELAAVVPGAHALEANLHDCFFNSHIRGEWFEPTLALLNGIAALQQGQPVEVAFDLSKKEGSVSSKWRKAQRNYPPEQRQRLSYGHRLRWARKRLDAKGMDRFIPDDCSAILCDYDYPQLTPAEIKRLDEVLADPAKHFQTREQRWPQKVAA